MTQKRKIKDILEYLLHRNERLLYKNITSYLNFCDICEKQVEFCNCVRCQLCKMPQFQNLGLQMLWFICPPCEENYYKSTPFCELCDARHTLRDVL